MCRAWLLALLLCGCAGARERSIVTTAQSLGARRVAFAIVSDDQIIAGRGLDYAHPLASLTKPLTGVLALDLSARGRLRIEGDVEDRLRHRAGRADHGFYYDSEAFAGLAPTLERAAGEPLAAAFSHLFLRLGMKSARAPESVRASGGVVASARDLAALLRALAGGIIDVGRLRPPYDLGWFIDDHFGSRILWHYGQEDDASALLLWIPERRLGLIVLADGDRLSAPFYLFNGQLARSPLALAWLRQSGFAVDDCDLTIARALALGTGAMKAALARCPEQARTPDPSLLAAFARSGDAGLRALAEAMGRALLAADPGNPRVLFDLAVAELQAHELDQAHARLTELASLRLRYATALKRSAAELLDER
jgi:CubicO group peptidase (beta-lactamase class C family)